jgi:hypothetical protein
MATETLRPNAAGDKTELTPTGDTYCWQCVDEASSDSDTTYVEWVTWTTGDECLLNLPIPENYSNGTINSVTVYAVARRTGSTGTFRTIIKIDGTQYDGDNQALTDSYASVSKVYAVNPKTSTAWSWDNIASLQIGARMYTDDSDYKPRCTQVYAVVDYTPAAGWSNIASVMGIGQADIASINGIEKAAIASINGIAV